MILADLRLKNQDQDKGYKNIVLDSELDTKTINIFFLFLDLIACGLELPGLYYNNVYFNISVL